MKKIKNKCIFIVCMLIVLFISMSCNNSRKFICIDGKSITDCEYTFRSEIIPVYEECTQKEIESTLRYYYDNPPQKDSTGKVIRECGKNNSKVRDSIIGEFLVFCIDTNKYSYMIINDTIKKINSYTLKLKCNTCANLCDDIYFNLLTIDTNKNIVDGEHIQIGKEYNMIIFPYYENNYSPTIESSTNVRINDYYIMRVQGKNVYTSPNINGLLYKQ
ncbi:MAG: hypothetical protein LKE30_04710 [Bacteroidales bacterium]|nr:hypothetical protein [Bacteroidales bacterium]